MLRGHRSGVMKDSFCSWLSWTLSTSTTRLQNCAIFVAAI